LDFLATPLLLEDGEVEFASLKAPAATTATCELGKNQIRKTAMTGVSRTDLSIEISIFVTYVWVAMFRRANVSGNLSCRSAIVNEKDFFVVR